MICKTGNHLYSFKFSVKVVPISSLLSNNLVPITVTKGFCRKYVPRSKFKLKRFLGIDLQNPKPKNGAKPLELILIVMSPISSGVNVVIPASNASLGDSFALVVAFIKYPKPVISFIFFYFFKWLIFIK